MPIKFTAPTANQTFKITSEPVWPSVVFTTDKPATDAHTWEWSIAWKTFSKKGKETTTSNSWDAKTVITDLGGELTVKVTSGKDTATIKVKILGDQTEKAKVVAYVGTLANASGFEKLLEHESKMKHFTDLGEPKKSFDNGYGICQLTTPTPTYDQVWNWKKNIDAGVGLYQQKQRAAIGHLTQNKRTYTDDQLKRETICRWNGGSYHEWDGTQWVRKSNILCDSRTGNIGWDMTDERNKDKSEEDLHKRDSNKNGSYPARKGGEPWIYSGVCYADAILGS